MSSDKLKVKVLSYNCHGLKLIAANRNERFRSIGDFIDWAEFDIACLQEVFVSDDYRKLCVRLQHCLPYSYWYKNESLVGTSGLAIFSRWPLQTVQFYQFRLNGNPFRPWHGDWYARKGAGYACIITDRLPSVKLHVFNTHLLANYGGEYKHSQYAVHRACQAYELARFVESICGGKAQPNSMLLLLGDVNTLQEELGYTVLQNRLNLFDCHPCMPNCSCKEGNHHSNAAEPKITCEKPEKIDYILVRIPKNMMSIIDVFKEEGLDVNGEEMSDHLPLSVRFSLDFQKEISQSPKLVNAADELKEQAYLKPMERKLRTYLKGFTHSAKQVTGLLFIICLMAFLLCLFLFHLTILEIILLLVLLLWIQHTFSLLNIMTLDSECKAILYLLECVQLDLAHIDLEKHNALIPRDV